MKNDLSSNNNDDVNIYDNDNNESNSFTPLNKRNPENPLRRSKSETDNTL